MEETDRLFTCEFCRVKSYLVAKDVFRYLLPGQAPESKDLLYFPYWRFKGMLFSCAATGVAYKFVDISHQAVLSHLFPVSLGLRSQALKLKFVNRKTAGRFLKPTQSFEQIEKNFEDRVEIRYFQADGLHLLDLIRTTREVERYVRMRRRPAFF